MKKLVSPLYGLLTLVACVLLIGWSVKYAAVSLNEQEKPLVQVVESVKADDDKPLPAMPPPAAEGMPADTVVNNAGVHSSPSAPGKVQVAILLDVSNSMDGLIDQAKAQLWNMVNLLGNARCNGAQPQFELALYEYGRPQNGPVSGYVRQLHAFTRNLDSVSATLFSLNTNGGDEYCTEVIAQSVKNLKWDVEQNTYKVLFIAGNESFRQGSLNWSEACRMAREKGVIVNTIYCGDRQDGIKEYWSLGAECGGGSYTHINQDAAPREIPTPYDSILFVLNDQLNNTYVGYGKQGLMAANLQKSMDRQNYILSPSAAAKRVEVKSKGNVYRNESWDLVDAMESNAAQVKNLSADELPAELKGKSPAAIEAYLKEKKAERNLIQQKIAELSIKRNSFIKKAAQDAKGQAPTLENEIERILKEQAARFNMKIEE
jgi:hypothetical protein